MMPLFDPEFYVNEQQGSEEEPKMLKSDNRLAFTIAGIFVAFIIFVYMAT